MGSAGKWEELASTRGFVLPQSRLSAGEGAPQCQLLIAVCQGWVGYTVHSVPKITRAEQDLRYEMDSET